MKFRVGSRRDLDYVRRFLEKLGFSVENEQAMPGGRIHFVVPDFDRRKIPEEKIWIWREMPCWALE